MGDNPSCRLLLAQCKDGVCRPAELEGPPFLEDLALEEEGPAGQGVERGAGVDLRRRRQEGAAWPCARPLARPLGRLQRKAPERTGVMCA